MKKGYGAIAGLEKLTPEEIKQRNLETYGLRIKTFRNRAGMTAAQLAETLQVSTSSVQNWECGLTRPDPEYIYRMFSILNVEPNEFFGISGIGTLLTVQEKKLIRDFRALDEDSKEAVETFASAMRDKASARKLKTALNRMGTAVDRSRVVAAGDGEDWPEQYESVEVILFATPEVLRADEIFTVNGDSMEPQFHDNDRVLVQHCTELQNGDIGIFYVPGRGGVIKQVAYDRLHSLNPDYDDIFPYAEGAQVIGKVLGRITKDMVPSREEQNLYLEAVAMAGSK